MTYLPGAVSEAHVTVTVAPAGTAPGYWPHLGYLLRLGAVTVGLTLVTPTMNLLLLDAVLTNKAEFIVKIVLDTFLSQQQNQNRLTGHKRMFYQAIASESQ
jgi:hypothetical protein